MRMKRHFQSLTKKAKNIVITTHIHPDADGIGSEIALCMALRRIGKKAICVNEEPLMERYKYLDPEDVVISYDQYMQTHGKKSIDLFIVADTNALPRIGANVQNLAAKARDLIFIDHHPCPREVAAIHCIDTSKAATGELVGDLIESLGIELTKEMALPLYTAILIDTSSFRYPTVTANTHRLIAKLMDTGIEPPHAYNMIYGEKKVTYMQLLGRVLSSAQTTADESIAWISLSEETLNRFNVETEDTHGFINHLLILDNVKVACMFRQIGGHVKVSFRSAGNVDVGIMAQALGGGGHNHSAATILEGEMRKVIRETIMKLQLMLKGHEENNS